MKRILLSIVGTIAGLSAVLSFRTQAPAGAELSLPSAGLPDAAGPNSAAAGTATDAGSGAGAHRAKKLHAGTRPALAAPAGPTATASTAGTSPRQGAAADQTSAVNTATGPTGGATTNGQTSGTGAGSRAGSTPAPNTVTPPPVTHATSSQPPPPPPPPTTSTAPAPRTLTGQVVKTKYGIVQVQITVTGAKITNVAFVQLTSTDSRSQQINQNAAPILLQQTLTAQSANIDGVSGATYTSNGYKQSLQSALDQAG